MLPWVLLSLSWHPSTGPPAPPHPPGLGAKRGGVCLLGLLSKRRVIPAFFLLYPISSAFSLIVFCWFFCVFFWAELYYFINTNTMCTQSVYSFPSLCSLALGLVALVAAGQLFPQRRCGSLRGRGEQSQHSKIRCTSAALLALDVLDQKLPKAAGQHVLGLLVAPITSVGHQYLALESSVHLVVSASGFPPVPLNFGRLVWLVLDEPVGLLCDSLGFHTGTEGSRRQGQCVLLFKRNPLAQQPWKQEPALRIELYLKPCTLCSISDFESIPRFA